MLNPKETKGFHFTPYLMNTINCMHVEAYSDQIKRLEEIKSKFNFIIGSLDKLKKNPEGFYKTGDSGDISFYFRGLSKSFS